MKYTLALDASTERHIRTLLCLYIFELLRYRYVNATAGARFVRMPHTLAVLLAYLIVTYALTVGIVEGNYTKSIAWSACVGVVVWGVCNLVLMNISNAWSRERAEDDVMAGIASCILAGVVGANALNVWYLVAAIFLLTVTNESASSTESGILPEKALTNQPIPIIVAIHGKDHHGSVSFVVDNLFVVRLANQVSAEHTYNDAVLAAARASHPTITFNQVTLQNGQPVGLPTFADIYARAELTSLRAT